MVMEDGKVALRLNIYFSHIVTRLNISKFKNCNPLSEIFPKPNLSMETIQYQRYHKILQNLPQFFISVVEEEYIIKNYTNQIQKSQPRKQI